MTILSLRLMLTELLKNIRVSYSMYLSYVGKIRTVIFEAEHGGEWHSYLFFSHLHQNIL